jgi:hypothetical protein
LAKRDIQSRSHNTASESTGSVCTSLSGPSASLSDSSSSSKIDELEAFPSKMPSLSLAATSFRSTDFNFSGDQKLEWSLQVNTLGFAAHRFITSQMSGTEKDTIKGVVSMMQDVTLSQEELEALGIVAEARYFVFSYPVVTSQELKPSAKDSQVADIAFLLFGGYMYFDSDLVLRDVRAVLPASEGSIRFGPSQPWLPEWTAALDAQRWRPVTLPSLRAVGVRYFTWLRAGETVEGSTLCRNGGFAYLFHEPSEVGVLQARLDIYFQIEDREEEVRLGRRCPRCSRPMEWSDFSEGAYAGGWTCEYIATCSQAKTDEAPKRWFCSHCHMDICGACSAGLATC